MKIYTAKTIPLNWWSKILLMIADYNAIPVILRNTNNFAFKEISIRQGSKIHRLLHRIIREPGQTENHINPAKEKYRLGLLRTLLYNGYIERSKFFDENTKRYSYRYFVTKQGFLAIDDLYLY